MGCGCPSHLGWGLAVGVGLDGWLGEAKCPTLARLSQDLSAATRREIPRGWSAPPVLADRLGWGLQVVAYATGGKQQRSARHAPRLTADGRMQTEQYEPLVSNDNPAASK